MFTILLIDDHTDLLNAIDEFLEFEGFRVLKARRGAEGILLAQEHQPDVIVCDMMMPSQNGREVYEILQQNEDTARIPFALITANLAIEPRKGERLLYKPFSMNDMLNLLRELLSEA